MKTFSPSLAVLLCASLLEGRQEKHACDTHALTSLEQVELHRQSRRSGNRRLLKYNAARAASAPALIADVGDIAVLDDVDGVIARRNPFNLQDKTLRFIP